LILLEAEWAHVLDVKEVAADELTLTGRFGNETTGTKLNHFTRDITEDPLLGIAFGDGAVYELILPNSTRIESLDFNGTFAEMHLIKLTGPLSGLNVTYKVYRGQIYWYDETLGRWIVAPGFTGTATVGPLDETSAPNIEMDSFVVPLPDYDKDEGPMIPAQLGNDDYEFGGYDDFALTATGIVYITANVHDISFYVTDNLGNPLPSGDTEVRLILPNGEEVTRSPAPPEMADVMPGSLAWSYKWFGEGNVTYFQLPGAEGPYGIRVLYHGTEVYYERDEVDVLYKTEFVEVVVKVFKIKLIFEDCQGNLIPDLWFKYTLPNGHTDWDHATDEGEYDFPYISGGIITIHAAWWKGVEVPLMKAMHPNGTELPLTADGELKLNVDEGIDAPIIIKIPIKDIIFYTYNFEGDYKIPRLNITLTWVGTPKPWSTETVYFLETLDPTGDLWDSNEDCGPAPWCYRNDYNTSVVIHPLWFKYNVTVFFQKLAEDSPKKELEEYEAKYVFYKMPPTIYNITVTTVTNTSIYGEHPWKTWAETANPFGFVNTAKTAAVTPGTSKWPGRTDMPVPYEIKIYWKYGEEYEDTVPTIAHSPAKLVNDRVVLRVFGSMGGVPVNSTTFPDFWEAWNPGMVGDRTNLTCKEEVNLYVWAHDFWKRVINGDLRVGDAEFRIRNDNGLDMYFYDVDEERWIGYTHTSKWTSDVLDVSRIMKGSHYTSNIWWNGSYVLHGMKFATNMTYSYSKGDNASFIVDKFFNASAAGTRGADKFWSPNQVDPTLNFTLVGTEKLWKTSRRFPIWASRIENETWKGWYPAWFLVYELPTPEDEYKVFDIGPDGKKGVLPIPIPVAFVKLRALAKDGSTPLARALIEQWILHMDLKQKVDISDQEGSKNFTFTSYDSECKLHKKTVTVSWKWEKKLKESAEAEVYEEEKWDRITLTFTTYKTVTHVCKIPTTHVYGINLTNTLRDTRIAMVTCGEGQLEVWLHYVGHNATKDNVTYTVELKWNGDLLAANTTTLSLSKGGYIMVGGIKVDITPTASSAEPGRWVVSDVTVSGTYTITAPATAVEKTRTIFVQVPPSPAKLILRDVVAGVDVAISRDYIYPLIDSNCTVDQNVEAKLPIDRKPSLWTDTESLVEDKWATPDGILSYGRWITDEEGYVATIRDGELVASFVDLGKDDPRYGTIVMPTSGWLNETFHDNWVKTEDEFHYQLNIVWKSAVVYSDNYLLTKVGYETKPSEVYSPTFYMALSNNTATPLAGLTVTLWYPNVTIWHDEGLWHTVPEKPEDLAEDIEDVPVYLSEEEVWTTGSKSFELIPGPRFMNTTWKYEVVATHEEIDWLDNLVATQFVLNNETFGDDGLRAAGRLSIDVPFMLRAAKWIVFEVATWRDEAGVPTAYPMPDYVVKYKVRYWEDGAEKVVAAEGAAITDAEGKVVLKSSTSDPTKVFWEGMTIRYRVEPPIGQITGAKTWANDYADDFWKSWLTARKAEFIDKKADYKKPTIPPLMTHAFYPDEEPTHWALKKIETIWHVRPDGKHQCTGLCVHEYRSKPFVVWVDYTAVTVRVTDFNGRPLEAAFVYLVDKATGKIAAWHYTAGVEWEAKPIDLATFDVWHGLDVATDTVKIPFQSKARTFGGAGFTGVMNVTVGPVAYDANDDDVADFWASHRGVPGKPDTSFVTYIVRAYWLSDDETPSDAKGTLKAVWPFFHPESRPVKAQKVYDSEEDETEWKLMLPRYVAGAAYRPSTAPTYPEVMHIPTTEAPTGALVKEHRDIYAAVFDLKMRFSYDGKPLGEFAKDLVVTFERAYETLTFKGKDVIDVKFLPRGTYTVIAKWKDVEVARRTLDLSNVNVGTVTADIPLAMTDVSFKVVDMFGRPLKDAKVGVSPDTFGKFSNVGGIITIRAIVTTQTYSFKVSWVSPIYGTEASVTIADTPEGLRARKVVELPVGTVTVSVVDLKGRPIAGAEVTFGKVTKKTDAAGKAYFEGVPLEKEGAGISYDVTVKREGFVVFTGTETVSRSRTTITEIGELFTIRVRVVGAAGQGLPFAKVVIKRAGAEIGTYTTDEGGFLEVRKVPLSDYTVEAEWKGFRGSATISKDDLKAGRAVEISLPPYTEIAGIPLTFGALLALIIGFIILVIVIVILLSEYVRWRGRRLGIYPPPPPKK